VSSTRSNIELDDDLVEAAMRLYGTGSKRESVDLALRRLVGARLGVDEAIAMEGSGREGDLDRMGQDAPPDEALAQVSDLVAEHPQP
jgi:Arc/MetJ family transcription regulator